jgi:adenylate kinase family enzyme
MKRIMIIGCGGSGKSTLATRLGEKLSLPVYHLDRLFWQPGWKELPKEQWRAVHDELCSSKAEWILDGNYGGTMEGRFSAADTIVFLDLPTATCLLGAVQRFFRYRHRSRPDITEGSPEKLDWDYLRWICTYRRDRRPTIISRLKQLEITKCVIILQSRRAVRRFLDDLPNGLANNALGRTPTSGGGNSGKRAGNCGHEDPGL